VLQIEAGGGRHASPEASKDGHSWRTGTQRPNSCKDCCRALSAERDPTKRRLDQGVTPGYPPDKQANPLCKSQIRPEAQGLHPLGALARTHVSQMEGDYSSVTSIRAQGQARELNPLRKSLIHPEARGLHLVGALVRTHISRAEREQPKPRQPIYEDGNAFGLMQEMMLG
jgi:hypothetical protein